MSLEYRIPRIFWENLESILLAHTKRYVGELARRLEVPEKELLKKVLPSSDSLKVIIQDSQAVSTQCKAYIQNKKLTTFCRKPVAYGCEYCSFHQTKRMNIMEGVVPPLKLQRIKDINTIEPIWLDTNGSNTIYDSNGDVVGKMDKNNNRIKLFIIET